MGVKAFNVASLSKVHLMAPKEVGYQDSLDIIRDELQRTRRSFVKIGWYLKHIKDEEMFKTDGYADIFELAMDKFNISQPTANRFMNICKEFSVDHDSPELDEKFVDYSVSQLFEMLPMDEEKREQITPDMTVRQIREMKEDTRKKNEEQDEEQDEENNEIPGQTSIEKDFPEYMPDYSAEEEQLELEIEQVRQLQLPANEANLEPPANTGLSELSEDNKICEEKEKLSQPELPNLNNSEQRKAWLADYKAWGLWYCDEHIDVNYYKYDFSDGSRLIVAEYPKRERYWSSGQEDEYYYHLLKKGKEKYGSSHTYDEKYRHSTDSETNMIEFLKNLQKEKKGNG